MPQKKKNQQKSEISVFLRQITIERKRKSNKGNTLHFCYCVSIFSSFIMALITVGRTEGW
jgi:hypothetical protein